MPIKIFKCNSCGNVFEELVLKDTETPECPKCKSKSTKQTFLGQLLGKIGCFEGG